MVVLGHAQKRDYAVLQLDKKFTNNANSVIVEQITEIDVTKNDRMLTTFRQVITVLNKKGDKEVIDYVAYDDDVKIKNLEATIYDASGERIKRCRKSDFVDRSIFDGVSIYNDNRLLVMGYTPASYPYTSVIEYTTESRTTAFIPPWEPIDSYYVTTLKDEYILKYNPENKPRMKSQHLNEFNVEISEGPSEIKYTATNLEAIRYEEHSLSLDKFTPNVKFALNEFYLKGVSATAKNWKEFGNWMQNKLLHDVSELPVSAVEQAKALTANETTNIGKAKKIYDYLQSKVRYISVQVGIGGWKPMLAEDVDKLAYGDCKALTNYTKAMLDAIGVPSYYTVLHAGDSQKSMDPEFSTMEGNHVLLGVPDGEKIWWLECTSQSTPFGYNGSFSDDRDVLIITEDGGEIVRTKAYTSEDSKQVNNIEATVGVKGGLKAKVSTISTGLQYENKYWLDRKTESEQKEYYKDFWDYINGFKLTSIQFENDREAIVFKENLTIDIPGYCAKVGNDYLLALNVFNRSDYIPPRIPSRKRKLYLSQSYLDTDTVDITLADNLEVASIPEPVRVENKFGLYTSKVEKIDDKTYRYERRIMINKGVYPKEDYAKYRNFRKEIARHDKVKILLTNNN